MFKIIDSHCHLHSLPLDKLGMDLDQVLNEAEDHHVESMLTVSIDAKTLPRVIEIAEKYSQVYASSGIHPCDVHDISENDWALVKRHAENPKVVAIGETGLDYYHSVEYVKTQQALFKRHIHLAKEVSKPLIIHTRSAKEDTIKVLKNEGARDIGGVLHCFTESKEMAKQALDLGFYISFSGIITFKNALELKDVVKFVPMDRLLIETDAPYLAPMPHRGKINRPAWVYHVAQEVAQLRGIHVDEVAATTYNNTKKLFSF